MIRENLSEKLRLGDIAPEFTLTSTDGQVVNSSKLDAKALLVIFMCNHCPYVVGSIRMLNQTVQNYIINGLAAIGINSNDPVKYPQDSFENMKMYAKEWELCFPYCFDETQEVAKSFDAVCTPELYLFNEEKKLVYHGGINDCPNNPNQATRNFLDEVLTAFFRNEDLIKFASAGYRPQGCSIKWR